MNRAFVKVGLYFSVGMLAVTISDYLYREILVPVLPDYKSAPLYLWVLVNAPVILLLGAIGTMSKSVLEIARLVLIVTIASQFYGIYAAENGLPGYQKSFALEDPSYYLTVISLGYWIFFMACSLVFYIPVKMLRVWFLNKLE